MYPSRLFTFPSLLLLLLIFARTRAAPTETYPVLRLQARYNGSSSVTGANSTSNKLTERFESGWVSGPDHRGTLQLVFSCVFTLFLCVWTTVHVNIEPHGNYNTILFRVFPSLARESGGQPTESIKAVGLFLANKFIRKLGWGFATLIVPEGALCVAAYERRTAHMLLEKVKESGKYPGFDLSLAYYAVMGGFTIPRGRTAARHDTDAGAGEGDAAKKMMEAKNDTDAGSGEGDAADKIMEANNDADAGAGEGDAAEKKTMEAVRGTEEEQSDPNEPCTLTPHGVLKLVELGKLPEISADEVRDKSNADSLAKILVFWQALWMIVQVIARTANRLPVTLLELHTVLHTFCAVVMYITWWAKPVDVDLPTEATALTPQECDKLRNGVDEPNPTNPFAATAGGEPHDRRYLTTRAGLGKLMYLDLAENQNILRHYFTVMESAYRTLWASRKRLWVEGLFIALVGLIYGGVHLAAWNYRFPSQAEKILWQVASLITAIAWSTFVFSLCLSILVPENSKWIGRICGVVFGIGVFPCLGVRIYLLLEGFIGLRKLPMGSYKEIEWVNAWPHIS